MARFRPILTYSAVLVVVFAAATAIGYVYAYAPERDLVEVVIDRSSPPASDAEFASGTVSSQSGDTLTIESALGILEVRLADVILEELRPLTDPTRIDAGTAVNLGGGRSPVDRIISGVVLIPDASP